MVSTSQSTQDTIAKTATWEEACDELIKHLIDEKECFSSGELTDTIREHRPDFRFRHGWLGDRVRDAFYKGDYEYDDGFGTGVPAVAVPRTTKGLGRTPAGIKVFVYGPDADECDAHHFEIDINDPNAQAGGSTGPAAISAPSQTPTQTMPVVLKGSDKVPDMDVTVHTDRRICVTRAIMEAFIHEVRKPMRGGDPCYIKFDDGKAHIRLDAKTGYEEHGLQTTRGRVLFAAPKDEDPFDPGTVYPVEFKGDEIIVNVMAPKVDAIVAAADG